jgi:hypothetical protein
MDTIHIVNYVSGAKVTLDCGLDVQKRNHPEHVMWHSHSPFSRGILEVVIRCSPLIREHQFMLNIGHADKWNI